MSVGNGQTISATFTTRSPTTGAAVNADTLPTATVTGYSLGNTVTVTNVTTGKYTASVTLRGIPDGAAVEIVVAATVGDVFDNLTIFRDTCGPSSRSISPASIPGLVGWWEPRLGGIFTTSAGSTVATADGDLVGYVRDLSGNGNDGTQPTSGQRRTLRTAGPGGTPCLEGTTGSLLLGTPPSLDAMRYGSCTRVHVVQPSNVNGQFVMLAGRYLTDGSKFYDLVYGGTAFRYWGVASANIQTTGTSGHLVVGTAYTIIIQQDAQRPIGTAPAKMRERIWINGRLCADTVSNNDGWDTSAGWHLLGDAANIIPFAGKWSMTALYNRGLTASERQRVGDYASVNFGGMAPPPCPDPSDEPVGGWPVNVICGGNSITLGFIIANGWPWPVAAKSYFLSGDTGPWANYGTGGWTTTQVAAQLATVLPYIHKRGKLNVLILWEGSNHITVSGVTGAQAYAALVTASNAARANGFKVIVGTIIDRGVDNGPYTAAQWNTERLAANALIRADTTNFDGVMDVGNGGTITVHGQSIDTSPIGAYGSSADTTYFGDKIHLLPLGQDIVARTAAAALATLVEASIGDTQPGKTIIQTAQTDATAGKTRVTTALPNVAPGAVGGVPVAVDSAGRVDARNVTGTLTVTERDAIASRVEYHLIDEADGQTIVNAIVGAIGNTNLDQAAVVAAIRADLERSGGKLAIIYGKLPTKSTLAGTNNADGDLQLDEATGLAKADIRLVSGSGDAAEGLHTLTLAYQSDGKLNAQAVGVDAGAITNNAFAAGALNGKGDWATADALQAVSDAVAAGQDTGNGDIAVDHNTGGTDTYRFTIDGVPQDNVTVRAYVQESYDAGTIDPEPPSTKTGSDGRFLAPLYLDADTYLLTAYNPATKKANVIRDVVVA